MQRMIKRVTFHTLATPQMKRVAAYARVSSDKDPMGHSLSAQISYFNALIQKHPDWTLVGIYADEGITGTRADRPEFVRLLDDCRAGKIDMVCTKSISRFARNTLTLLETIRELKSLGVDVYFEEQNIHSISGDGELMLTILASYAQEESISASENQKWRIRSNFKEGLPWNGTVLGYRIENGVYVPQENEAEIVRLIFDCCLQGMGVYKIAKTLNEAGIRTRKGNLWCQQSVRKLLRNYAYTGNLLLQTSYVEDPVGKKKRVNTGQLPMYHAEGTHDAIIPTADFQAVQETLRERAEHYGHTADPTIIYPFRGKLVCQGCGKNYRRKVARRGPIWICSTFNTKGKQFCPSSKAIPEDTLMATTAQVLGSDTFDEALFLKRVKQILVGTGNSLTYIFYDGHTVTTTWQDRSRRESWTAEKKEAARQTALQHECCERDAAGKFLKKTHTKEEVK